MFLRAIRPRAVPEESCVFFDDRLATVLRLRATGEAGLRTQYRQLLDLLGRARMHGDRRDDQSLLAAAWLRMDALAEAIPAPERARMIRESGWRFRSPDLAAHLADHEPEVAAAALSRADLSVEDWTTLIPRLPVRARGFLRLRRDLPVDVEALLVRLGVHDRGLPAPAAAATPAIATDPQAHPEPSAPAVPMPTTPRPARSATPIPLRRQPAPSAPSPRPARDRDDSGRTEISALVERIAQFRRERGESRAELERSPRLPLGELPERPERSVTGFGFAADAAGRIEWAATEVAPMVVGTRLFAAQRTGEGTPAERNLERTFLRRQPIVRAQVSLAGATAIAGTWLIDAEPRFSDEGHFTGYVGRFRRLPDLKPASTSPEAREADRIRQLLHELRTPVTAVQGYAEVIQQQLFGPAPHEYRALAAAIAADAARILAGFEELDRLARLETGAIAIEPGESDLATLVQRTAEQLDAVLATQNAGFTLSLAESAAVLVAIDHEDAEALVWRLLASLAAACAPAERLAVRIDPMISGRSAMARLTCQLPARLAQADNVFAATMRPADSAINAGLFGAGFALRLARAEARSAGGSLHAEDGSLALTLPLLTGNPALPGARQA